MLTQGGQNLFVIILTGSQRFSFPLRLLQLLLQFPDLFLGLSRLSTAHRLRPLSYFLISLLHLSQLGLHFLNQSFYFLKIFAQSELFFLLFGGFFGLGLLPAGQLFLYELCDGLFVVGCDVCEFLDVGCDFGEQFAIVFDFFGGEEGDVEGALAHGLLFLGGLGDGLLETSEHSII